MDAATGSAAAASINFNIKFFQPQQRRLAYSQPP